MRHLVGFILAIALGAALYLGAGWGFTHLTGLTAQGAAGLTSPTGLAALSALAATGLFLGIVIAVRAISPLAPGLPGLVLLAWSALLAVREHQALRWIPLQGHSFGAGYRALLVSGVLALLGAAMIVPLFLPSRWRAAPGAGIEEDDSDVPVTELLAPPTAAHASGPADLSEPR
ncbi:MAG TPA: hypothetical protein VH642_00315 [Streptosporangiaceae bacterium]